MCLKWGYAKIATFTPDYFNQGGIAAYGAEKGSAKVHCDETLANEIATIKYNCIRSFGEDPQLLIEIPPVSQQRYTFPGIDRYGMPTYEVRAIPPRIVFL